MPMFTIFYTNEYAVKIEAPTEERAREYFHARDESELNPHFIGYFQIINVEKDDVN